MTTYWNIEPTLWPHRLILDRYIWEEEGFTLFFHETGPHGRNLTISFPVDLDGVQILLLHDDVIMEERLYALIQAADMPNNGPFLPAFIRDDADLIDQVRALNRFSSLERKRFLQYTIITDDFWIDVVSDQSPKITLQGAVS